ncbi:nucleotide exchange factor GrpE [Modestobacter roseus]|uniref:Protein GrpE n=1 Tax=Modestobacter roseus TaxID=1181884 RepID=A0A562IVB3_9ACTN|nr:nucleotide exchange factor GrpE [Modestobacter roseus]MQA32933.1 nucleotide exchange factor GrpE [Modestobacter roseus]TWH74615.1 molecular chaperone GrpE [Modestobacter roseus]
MSQQDEQAPRVVIRDRRRIDPTSGAVREPAGDQPAGPAAAQGEQMSEQNEGAAPVAEHTDVPAGDLGGEQVGDQGGETARQLAERTEDLQRVTAEYANYRRRVDRDRVLVVDQAAERFAGQLFPIVDDIERARDHGDLTGAFKVVADRVLGLLDGLGVESFGKPGDPFDPALHEAVLHDTSPEVTEPTATTVLRPGFRRGDRVLRTAMVGVTEPESPAPVAASPVAEQPAAAGQSDVAGQPDADPADR